MAIPNIARLTSDELDALAARIDKRREELHAEKVASVRAKIEQLLAKEEMALADFVPSRRKTSGGGKTPRPAKYRNPRNPAETWGGMGKRPDWIRQAVNRGTKLESFLISDR